MAYVHSYPIENKDNFTGSGRSIRSHASVTSVDSLRIGEIGTVIGIKTENSLLRMKLLCMGIVEGSSVVVTNIAPLKDPITVAVKGFKLSLRRNEARSIVISRSDILGSEPDF